MPAGLRGHRGQFIAKLRPRWDLRLGGSENGIRWCAVVLVPRRPYLLIWRQSVLPVHLLGMAPLLGCISPVTGRIASNMRLPNGAIHVMNLGRSKMGINKVSNADERTAYRQDRFVGASAYVQLSPQPGANLVGKHDVTGTYHPPVLSIVRCHPNVLNRSSFLTCNLGPRGRDRRAS